MLVSYTGIGSRKIPAAMFAVMKEVAATCASIDYCLRSGAADGADSAFEMGCDSENGAKEIFLPWKGFNDNPSMLYSIPSHATKIAQEIYPGDLSTKSQGVQKLMTRNVMQILGKDLNTPSSFVVCWTPDGCESHKTRNRTTGGTGQAIALASLLDIPIFNLKNMGRLDRLLELLYKEFF